MTQQRYTHMTTTPADNEDPFAPQLQGWELVAVSPHFAYGMINDAAMATLKFKGRTLYWKRPL